MMKKYFGELSADSEDILEEDADCMIRTIEKFYQIMCERRAIMTSDNDKADFTQGNIL